MSNSVITPVDEHRLAAFRAFIEQVPVKKLRTCFPGEYGSFRAMRARQSRGNATVHPTMESFHGFLGCLGPRPQATWTVDRINNDSRRYEPGNVQWASKREQANNRSNTILLRDKDGQVRSLTEWAKSTRQNPDTLRKRLNRGWSHDEVISGVRKPTPSQKRGPQLSGDAVERLWPTTMAAHAHQWEAWWSRWNSWCCGGLPDASRAVFCLWLVINIGRSLERRLADLYVDEFGESANPEGVVSEALTSDPLYIRYMRQRATSDCLQAQMVGNPNQEQLLRNLVRDFPNLTDPEQASKTVCVGHGDKG